MRRILYLSPMAPDPNTGGGRHVFANLVSLLAIADDIVIDVVSPPWPALDGALASDRVRRVLTRPYRLADKVGALAGRAATSLHGLWREARASLAPVYDLMFVETTRCGFAVAERAGRAPIVCVVHNVEADFLAQNRSGIASAARLFARRSERQTLAAADHLLVLHDADRRRLEALYGAGCVRGTFHHHPVCSLPPTASAPLPWSARRRWVAYVGSLDMPYNERGLLTFLAETWPRLQRLGHHLVIAGRRPTQRLIEAASRAPATILVPNPTDMEPLLRRARALVLPDRSGTGMKLRVAEALSHGVPVVGTPEGLRGYEDAFGVAVRPCDTPAEMSEAIAQTVATARGDAVAEQARSAWESAYTLEAFSARLATIIGPILERSTLSGRARP